MFQHHSYAILTSLQEGSLRTQNARSIKKKKTVNFILSNILGKPVQVRMKISDSNMKTTFYLREKWCFTSNLDLQKETPEATITEVLVSRNWEFQVIKPFPKQQILDASKLKKLLPN